MKDFQIEGNKDTLEVICKPGVIKMTGNSITPNANTFFEPVQKWVDAYVESPERSTEVTLQFHYIDTASVHSIFSILKKIKGIELDDHEFIINWYFEFDDPELLEVGEIMEARLDVKFNYVEYSQ